MTGHMTARSWRIRALVRVRRGRSARADGAEPVRAAAGRVRSNRHRGSRAARPCRRDGTSWTASARGRRLASYSRQAPGCALTRLTATDISSIACAAPCPSPGYCRRRRRVRGDRRSSRARARGKVDIVSQIALVSCLGHLRDRLVPAGEAPQDLRLPALRVVRLSLRLFLVANQYVRPRRGRSNARRPPRLSAESGGRAPCTGETPRGDV